MPWIVFTMTKTKGTLTMPRILKAITATDVSVVRPVIYEIARSVMKMTGINHKTQIFYPGEMEKVQQQGSDMNPDDNEELNLMPFNERISIEVDELFEEDRMNSIAVHRQENLPIFLDDPLEIMIKPVYAPSDITINFRYRAVDKAGAERWRNEMRARTGDEREVRDYSASYSYLIPPVFLVILAELHRMREAVAGYGEDYQTYFDNNSTKRITRVTTQSGHVSSLAVAETQSRINGWFDFTGVPEQGSREDEGDTWTISFSFKFKFDKPIACVMHYPIIIHNQIVDQKFRPSEPRDQGRWEKKTLAFAASASFLNHFEASNDVRKLQVSQGYGIPNFDEFIPADMPKKTLRVVTQLTQIDPDNPTLLFNLLTDLEDLEFTPEMAAFLKSEAKFMTQPYRSIFQLTLFRDHDIMGGMPLLASPTLDLTTVEPMELRSYYHTRLSIVTDLRILPTEALDRAREHGKAVIDIIKTLDPTVTSPELIDDYYIPRKELDKALDDLDSWQLINNGKERQMNTVETFFIRTRR